MCLILSYLAMSTNILLLLSFRCWKEYRKFASFTSSLLARSNKLGELITQLEMGLGDKPPQSAEAKRVTKPLAKLFPLSCTYVA